MSQQRNLEVLVFMQAAWKTSALPESAETHMCASASPRRPESQGWVSQCDLHKIGFSLASCIFASKASSDGKRQHLGRQTAWMAAFQALFLQYLFSKESFGI